MLRSPDDWIWDSWIADDGERYHLYFLRAPRALVDPGRRHLAATVGHASSADLVEWTDHGTVFGPAAGRWDDVAVWTGSVVRGNDGVWRMFYTGLAGRGYGVNDQRVGIAESDDLHTWRRVGAPDVPAVAADPRWYKTLDGDPTASETWRDPFVFRDPDGDGWRMLVTARAVGFPQNADGVLAEARSHDLIEWEVGPPVTEPAGFGQLEVPQVRVVGGHPTLVFTCHPQEQTPEQIARHGPFCTWSVTGPSVLGPWDIDAALPYTPEPYLFAAPLVQRRDGQWVFVGFRNQEPEGILSFDIIDPVPFPPS